MRTIVVSLLVAALVAIPASEAGAEWARVKRVVDGDTFELDDGTKVRVSEIDTPETKHPLKGQEPGGQEATQLARFFLEGNYVWLDGKAKDKYGRRVAKVQLPGGASYADIVRQHGYDKNSKSVYSRPTAAAPTRVLRKNPHHYASPDLVWVDGYIRRDGAFIPGYWRHKKSPPLLSERHTAPAPVARRSPPAPVVRSSPPAPVVRTSPPAPAPRPFVRPAHEPMLNPSDLSTPQMVWVDGYVRADGTYVRGYWRRNPSRATVGSSAPSSAPAWPTLPAASGARTSGDGKTVQVRGYHRKDGTYVAPHSRRPPKARD